MLERGQSVNKDILIFGSKSTGCDHKSIIIVVERMPGRTKEGFGNLKLLIPK